MDNAELDRDRILRSTRDDRAGTELEALAGAKVAKALRLLHLHNAFEALLPAGLPDDPTAEIRAARRGAAVTTRRGRRTPSAARPGYWKFRSRRASSDSHPRRPHAKV